MLASRAAGLFSRGLRRGVKRAGKGEGGVDGAVGAVGYATSLRRRRKFLPSAGNGAGQELVGGSLGKGAYIIEARARIRGPLNHEMTTSSHWIE